MTPFSCGIVLNSGSSFTCRDACAVMRVQACVCKEPRTYLKYLPAPKDVRKVLPDTPGRTASTSRHPRTFVKYLPTPQDVPKVPPDTPGRSAGTSRHPRRYGKPLPTTQDVRRWRRWQRSVGMRAGGGGTHPILRSP